MAATLVNLLSLIIAFAAIVVSLNQRTQLRLLREKLARTFREMAKQQESASRLPKVEARPARPVRQRLPLRKELSAVTGADHTSAITRKSERPVPPVPSTVDVPGSGWEERLGAKLPVWIGAVALMMAGIFMVRYFAQQGLLGPQTRMVLAGLSGVLMIGFAQWLLRGKEQIAQGLAAAGIGILYATLLGSVNLHGLISTELGFAGMVAVTIAAVILSLQHGRIVAFLGLAGGLMPALLGARNVSAVQLFGYLFLLQAALSLGGRNRKWWFVNLAALIGSLVWVSVWILFRFDSGDAAWLGLFLLGSVTAAVFAACESDDALLGKLNVGNVHAFIALGFGLPLSGWLLNESNFAVIHWLYLGILGTGCMVLARRRPQYLLIAAFAMLAPLVFVVMWGANGTPSHPRFTWVCLGMGSLWSIGAYVANFRSGHEAAGWQFRARQRSAFS